MAFFGSTIPDTMAKFNSRKERKEVATIATFTVAIVAIDISSFLVLVFARVRAFSCHQSSLCTS